MRVARADAPRPGCEMLPRGRPLHGKLVRVSVKPKGLPEACRRSARCRRGELPPENSHGWPPVLVIMPKRQRPPQRPARARCRPVNQCVLFVCFVFIICPSHLFFLVRGGRDGSVGGEWEPTAGRLAKIPRRGGGFRAVNPQTGDRAAELHALEALRD